MTGKPVERETSREKHALLSLLLDGFLPMPNAGIAANLLALLLLNDSVANSGRGVEAASSSRPSEFGTVETLTSRALCRSRLRVEENVVREGERPCSDSCRTDGGAEPECAERYGSGEDGTEDQS